MKWMGVYLIGYLLLVSGVAAALWKLGVLERIGSTWVFIGALIALGFGIMIAVNGSGEKRVVEIDRR